MKTINKVQSATGEKRAHNNKNRFKSLHNSGRFMNNNS